MSHLSDLQKQSSLLALMGRGMSRSFAEHLTEHVLQLSLFVGRKCCNPLLQSTLVNRPYLVGDNLAFASVYLAGNSERIAMDSRCDRDNDDRSKIPVEFIGTYHHAWTNLLYLSTDRRVEVNPIDIELLYHCQSSTLSSSNTSAATNWSSPCLCALRAAADQPFRTADLLAGTSENTARRMSRRAVSVFCIATSLAKIGLSSRRSSARKRNVVIIPSYLVLCRKGTKIK